MPHIESCSCTECQLRILSDEQRKEIARLDNALRVEMKLSGSDEIARLTRELSDQMRAYSDTAIQANAVNDRSFAILKGKLAEANETNDTLRAALLKIARRDLYAELPYSVAFELRELAREACPDWNQETTA